MQIIKVFSFFQVLLREQSSGCETVWKRLHESLLFAPFVRCWAWLHCNFTNCCPNIQFDSTDSHIYSCTVSEKYQIHTILHATGDFGSTYCNFGPDHVSNSFHQFTSPNIPFIIPKSHLRTRGPSVVVAIATTVLVVYQPLLLLSPALPLVSSISFISSSCAHQKKPVSCSKRLHINTPQVRTEKAGCVC